MNVPLDASQEVRLTGPSAPDPRPRLHVQVAQGFLARARGLIGAPMPAPGCGLLLQGTAAVHGFGMRYPLDLVFLGREDVILQCVRLEPARVASCRRALAVLEMRAGEVERLGLRPGMRLLLVPVAQIFGLRSGPPAAPSRCLFIALAVSLAGVAFHPASHGSPPLHASSNGHPAADAAARPGPLSLASPLAPQTLQHLEDEAEALYREPPDERRDRELIRLYETLAELGPHRSPHAWLRIGNIRQRSGAIGPAMEAYRRASVRPADVAGAALPGARKRSAGEGDPLGPSEEKALLNLAGLALEQARQSLDRLASQPTAEGPDNAQALDGTRGPKGETGSAASSASYRRHLDALAQSLSRQQERQERQEEPVAAGDGPSALRQSPYMVERYTASARRNRVKTAKGSLHAHPADQSLAPQVARPRSRPAGELLPSVEYLRGDPQRSATAADGKPSGKRARAEQSGRASTRRAEH